MDTTYLGQILKRWPTTGLSAEWDSTWKFKKGDLVEILDDDEIFDVFRYGIFKVVDRVEDERDWKEKYFIEPTRHSNRYEEIVEHLDGKKLTCDAEYLTLWKSRKQTYVQEGTTGTSD